MDKPKNEIDEAQNDLATGVQEPPVTEAPAKEPLGKMQEEVKAQMDRISAGFDRSREEIQSTLKKVRADLRRLEEADAVQKSKKWVADNPLLATCLALGTGLVLGKLLSEATKPAPPPPLKTRALLRAQSLADRAHTYVDEVGDVLVRRAAEGGRNLRVRASEAGQHLGARAHELGQEALHRGEDLAQTVARQADDWGEMLSDQAAGIRGRVAHTADVLADTAGETTVALRSQAGRWVKLTESLLATLRAAVLAVFVEKVSGWIRRS